MATSKRPRRSTSRAPEIEATNANDEPTVAPDTTEPVQQPESAPAVEQAAPFADAETAAPVAPDTTEPVQQVESAPAVEQTAPNAEPETAAPAVPDTTEPMQQLESAPALEQAAPLAASETAASSSAPTIAMSAERAEPSAAAEVPPPTVAPSSNAAAQPTAQSLASNRAPLSGRQLGIIGAIGLLILIVGLVAYSQRTPVAPAALAPVAQTTPTPEAAAPQPTALAPAAQTNPTAEAAAIPTSQPAAGDAVAGSITCNAIAGLPIYPNAPCIDQDTDQDDGAIKLENTYTANASTSDIGRFYERAFAENGWTLQAFQYSASLGQRSLEVEVETEQAVNGPATKIKLTEKGASTVGGTTCNAIAGLPSYPNATCVEFASSQDGGVIKNEHTYMLSAAVEDVRRFYESALTQNGWVGQEFQYDVTQGQRRLTIAVNTHSEQSSAVTRFKIAEQ